MTPPDEESKTVIADLSKISKTVQEKRVGIPCLIQYTGTEVGKRHILNKNELSIGRLPVSDISVADGSVSRAHARITIAANEVTVEDLGSSNGSFVNDKRLDSAVILKDQDLLRVGLVAFKFFSQDNMDGFIQDAIYKKATTDVGTGIYNKQYLLEHLENEFHKAKATQQPLSIVYFDLDHFKKVNDTYGHNAGDQVLRGIADLVKGLIRKNDIFARFGGEEFVVVLPQTTLAQAAVLAELFRKKSEEYRHKLGSIEHQQTLSSGVAQQDASMHSPKDLLESADKKLYLAKTSGRNKVIL
jgi:two-component system cell cycle response regulator